MIDFIKVMKAQSTTSKHIKILEGAGLMIRINWQKSLQKRVKAKKNNSTASGKSETKLKHLLKKCQKISLMLVGFCKRTKGWFKN